jgi:hypothetical protein
MQRPIGVSLSAVFLGLAALLIFLLTIVLAQVSTQFGNRQSTHLIAAVLIIPFAAATIYTICILIGLLRSKNWARLGGIVLGIGLALFAALLLLLTTALFLVPQLQHKATLRPGVLIAELFYVLIGVFGIWLAIYLNTAPAKEHFIARNIYVPDTISYPAPPFAMNALAGATRSPSLDVPAHGYTRISSQELPQSRHDTSLARIVVLILCVISVAGSIYMLTHAFSGKAYFYLGFVMHGKFAGIFRVCAGSTILILSLGVIRRYVPAYYGLLLVQLSNITSVFLMFVRDFRRHSLATSANGTALAHNFRLASIAVSLLIGIVFAWALWCDLREMRESEKPATPTMH